MFDLRIFNTNPLKRDYNKAVRTALLALLLKNGEALTTKGSNGWEV
jgi:hypothetical protein